jgi:hypothetical protein
MVFTNVRKICDGFTLKVYQIKVGKFMRISFGAIAILAALSGCGQTASVTPQVNQYIANLPKGDSKTAVLKIDWFARKDSLTVNGLVITGNWTPGNATVACTHQASTSLSLTNIDHFDDLPACPDGGQLVRAVMKN